MASYLLLRNNKESGPYSLEALIQLGLKPYDLVWVKDKSAAWRYPSEIEDLKFYAPVVEEQPYDRFYKKPSEEQKEKEKQQSAKQTKAINVPSVEQKEIPQIKEVKEIVEVNIGKKQVFVSMPANAGSVFVKRPEQVAAQSYSTNSVKASAALNANDDYIKKTEQTVAPSFTELVNEYNSYQPQEKKIPVAENSYAQKESYPLETKYSQSLDDIKDIYVQTLADRKRKTANKKKMLVLGKRLLPFAAVLIAGFIMGTFMMNKKSGNDAVVKANQTALTTQQLPVDNTALKPEVKAEPQVLTPTEEVALQQGSVTTPVTENKLTADKAAFSKVSDPQKNLKLDKSNATNLTLKKSNQQETAATNPAATYERPVENTPKNIEPDPKTGERKKIVRSGNETTDDNSNAVATSKTAGTKSGSWKQVNVKSNDFKVGSFGGIHDLQLTVSNNSNYLLDRVVVELQYLKPTDQPVKTNNIQFDLVPPNGSLTLAIPATTRGVKIVYKIIHVESKAAGNDTAAL